MDKLNYMYYSSMHTIHKQLRSNEISFIYLHLYLFLLNYIIPAIKPKGIQK
jgi:hypothetical protein